MKHVITKGVLLMMLTAIFIAGCAGETGSMKTKTEAKKAAAPAFYFHRPNDFGSAITRLHELNLALMDDKQITIPPRKIEYVEVIHKMGNSGHSHYYLASDYDQNLIADDDHGHGEEVEETIKRETTEVDLRTELADVIGWLPELAALTDLEEDDWKSVKVHTSKLKEITAFLNEEQSQSNLRVKWQSQSADIQATLDALQSLAAKGQE